MTSLGKIIFPSKVPEFLYVFFNLVEKHSPVSFFSAEILLFRFVAFIVRALIFDIIFLRSKV